MKIYTAKKLTILVEQLVEEINNPTHSTPIFQPEIIVVQSRAMMQYLKIELTKRLGVIANIEFPFAFHLIGELKEKIGWDGHTLYDPSFLRWVMVPLIKKMAEEASEKHPLKFLDFKSRLDKEKNLPYEIDHFKFAFKMTNLFDQYDFFRTDTVHSWNLKTTGTKKAVQDDWQRDLWNQLRDLVKGPSRREEIEKLVTAINQYSGTHLPPRIFIFGISQLPEVYIEFLKELKHIAVSFFYFDVVGNTSSHFIKEISSTASHFKNNLLMSGDTKELTHEPVSLDTQVEKSQEVNLHPIPLLQYTQSLIHPPPDEEDNKHLRETIQSHLKEKTKTESSNSTLNIQIHSCPTIRREVEVLKNNLLAWLELQPEVVQLNDILVMAPNIEDYLPQIKSIFSEPPYLHLSIADKSLKNDLNLYPEISNLFKIFISGFKISTLYPVLDSALIQNNWNLSPKDILIIKNWLKKTQFRQDGDGDEKNGDDKQHSLYRSLKKLTYSYFIDPLDFDETDSLIFEQDINRDEGLILGKFASLCRTLFNFNKIFNKPANLIVWLERVRQVQELFLFRHLKFRPNKNYSPELLEEKKLLLKQISRLETEYSSGEDIINTINSEPFEFSCKTFYHLLDEEFQETSENGFLLGGITFSSILPMRALPFKAIALIGMGDDFPKGNIFSSFSLMNQYRPGDRSPQKDDELMFLETLISCKNFLHISYQGINLEKNSEQPLSILASNLIFTLAQSLGIPPNEFKEIITLKHGLRGFDPDQLFSKKPYFFYQNYRETDFQLAHQLQQAVAHPEKTKRPLPPWTELINKQFTPKDIDSYYEDFSIKIIANQNPPSNKLITKKIESIIANLSTSKTSQKPHKPTLPLSSLPSSLTLLKKVLKNPIEHFNKEILLLSLSLDDDELEEGIKYNFNYLEKSILFKQIDTDDNEIILPNKNIFIKKDWMTRGVLGKIEIEKLEKEYKGMADKIKEMIAVCQSLNSPNLSPTPTSPEIKNFKISSNTWNFDYTSSPDSPPMFVSIPQIVGEYHLHYRNNKTQNYDFIQAWLNHLFLSFIPNFKGTIIFNSEWTNGTTKKRQDFVLYLRPLNENERKTAVDCVTNIFNWADSLPLPLVQATALLKNSLNEKGNPCFIIPKKQNHIDFKNLLIASWEKSIETDEIKTVFPEGLTPTLSTLTLELTFYFYQYFLKSAQTISVENLKDIRNEV